MWNHILSWVGAPDWSEMSQVAQKNLTCLSDVGITLSFMCSFCSAAAGTGSGTFMKHPGLGAAHQGQMHWLGCKEVLVDMDGGVAKQFGWLSSSAGFLSLCQHL